MKIELKEDELIEIENTLASLAKGNELYAGQPENKDYREYLYQIACSIYWQRNKNK